jgi:hypothetical protein
VAVLGRLGDVRCATAHDRLPPIVRLDPLADGVALHGVALHVVAPPRDLPRSSPDELISRARVRRGTR